ncbi:MAG: transcription antitermination factor NusB [Clostridiales bacterium]|jgi:N utilization substance protein B|nr:transcription antitermination factor NusB [Clostridiales bacterium]
MNRRTLRKHAFSIIYQLSFHETLDLDAAAEDYFLYCGDLTESDRAFVYEEIHGTLDHLAEIDALIARCAKGWRLDRLSTVDLAVMRMAANEILYRPDIPTGVAINEAVNLCKIYGDDDSPRFVNGVLSKIASISQAAAH